MLRPSWKSHYVYDVLVSCPNPMPRIVPLHPGTTARPICDHVFFWRVCPRPCRQNQKYYQSAFSLHKSALALALGCTSMPKLGQKLHLYTLSLSSSQVPGLRLFFNTQSQLGAVFLYLLCCNHPSLSSQNQHPESEGLTYKFLLSALKSTKLRQQKTQNQSSAQHRQTRISDQTHSQLNKSTYLRASEKIKKQYERPRKYVPPQRPHCPTET